MNTIQIIKRTLTAACVMLTLATAAVQPALAGTSVTDTPVERPMVGDGQETHGGKG